MNRMQTFTHVVATDGIRTTVAGRLAQHARAYRDTTISVTSGTETARTTQLLRLLGLNFDRGQQITVRADGPQEDLAVADLRRFCTYYI